MGEEMLCPGEEIGVFDGFELRVDLRGDADFLAEEDAFELLELAGVGSEGHGRAPGGEWGMRSVEGGSRRSEVGSRKQGGVPSTRYGVRSAGVNVAKGFRLAEDSAAPRCAM